MLQLAASLDGGRRIVRRDVVGCGSGPSLVRLSKSRWGRRRYGRGRFNRISGYGPGAGRRGIVVVVCSVVGMRAPFGGSVLIQMRGHSSP